MWNIMKNMVLHIYKYHKLSVKEKQRLLRVQQAAVLNLSMLRNWNWRT